MKKPIIVGYDPGTTAALAILDTKGEILFLKSKRSFKRGDIIDAITDMGKPLLVAGDRRPIPKSVERMARSLGCRPFYPKKSLSIEFNIVEFSINPLPIINLIPILLESIRLLFILLKLELKNSRPQSSFWEKVLLIIVLFFEAIISPL